MKYIKKIKFDTRKFNFQKIVHNHFKKKNKNIKKDLSNIHDKIFLKKIFYIE